MTSTLTPEQIADKLTEAQRRALLAFDCKALLTPKKAGVAPITAYYLVHLDLLHRDYVDWPRLAWAYRLTPLGLSVRKVLQDRQQGGGHD